MHSRNLQLTLVWILLASLIMGVALWQAQVVVEREAAGKHKNLPPPTTTRHAIRPAPTASETDPVADYVALCEKGMTIQEIHWVLTDFENAGLATDKSCDDMTEAEATAYHKAQRQWYLGCLKQGLHLGREQLLEANKTLLLQSQEAVLEWRDKEEKRRSSDGTPAADTPPNLGRILERMVISGNQVDEVMEFPWMPWKLCELTTAQQSMTWKSWYAGLPSIQPLDGAARVDRAIFDEALNIPHRDHQQVPVDKSETLRFLLNTPYGRVDDMNIVDYPPSWIWFTNSVFPLLDCQKMDFTVRLPDSSTGFPPEDQKKFIQQLRFLHPAQLKMLLLLKPNLKQKIREPLDAAQD